MSIIIKMPKVSGQDGLCGNFDDDKTNDGFLQIEGGGGLMRVDVSFPDPDVDDSGLVDAADVTLVAAAAELQVFDPSFDLDGDGAVTQADVQAVQALEGLVTPTP